jgi:hypothetical protein
VSEREREREERENLNLPSSDAFTKLTWIYLLKTESDAFTILNNSKAWWNKSLTYPSKPSNQTGEVSL